MDRDEILEKARKEGDEMAVYAKDKSMVYTYIALVVSAGIFALVRGLRDEPIMDLCATVCFSVSVGRLYRFLKTKERFELVMAGIGFVIAVVAAIRFFMGH